MVLHKIAGIIVKEKKFLAVKEYDLDILMTPGGTMETNETPPVTLRRELKEELDVNLISMRPFGTFYDSKYDLILDTYFAEIKGEPKPNSEVEEIFWVTSKFRHKKLKLPLPMITYIIPKLLGMNLIE